MSIVTEISVSVYDNVCLKNILNRSVILLQVDSVIFPSHFSVSLPWCLEAGDRLGRHFQAALTAGLERGKAVDKMIHMIWLGSPLPLDKFAHGIISFVTLNPGTSVLGGLNNLVRIPKCIQPESIHFGIFDVPGPNFFWANFDFAIIRVLRVCVVGPAWQWSAALLSLLSDSQGCQHTSLADGRPPR